MKNQLNFKVKGNILKNKRMGERKIIQLNGKKNNVKKLSSASRKIFRILLIIMVFMQIGLLAGTIYAFNWLQEISSNIPSVQEPFKKQPLASVIKDRNGQELYKIIGRFNSDKVNYAEIPDHLKWAFIAAEDIDFFNHNGFDTAGIMRCGIKFFTDLSGGLCGGSTITQQLIKVTTLDNESSKIVRKIKELFMSTKVEQEASKDEILEMYLTVTPYGSNIVGIATAADFYFGKSPKDLTLAESALLAGIIQNPVYLSPTLGLGLQQEDVYCRYEDGALLARSDVNIVDETASIFTEVATGKKVVKAKRFKCRQLYVLGQMSSYKDKINLESKKYSLVENLEDIVTDEKIETARNEVFSFMPPISTNKLAGHFVDFVISELLSKDYKNGKESFKYEELQQGGYIIETTLDYNLQQAAERAVAKGGTMNNAYNVYNAAVVTLQPSTGEILTMAGSKAFYGQRQGCRVNQNGMQDNCLYDPEVNVITSPQSPGSTMKSLTYYLAFEKGLLYPGSLVPDIPIQVSGYGVGGPKNYDSRFQFLNGPQNTVREMYRESRNIPALTAIEMTTVKSFVEKAREFGYTVGFEDLNTLGLSVAIGGVAVLPLEHAAAHTVFANQGDYVQPESIKRIIDWDGNIVYEAKPKRKAVGNPQASYLLNQIALNYPHFQTWDGRDVAAKTGTSENAIDNWIVAWSPDFVTVGWVGNNNNDPINANRGFPIYTVEPWMRPYMMEIGNSQYFSAKTPFQRPGFIYKGGAKCNDKGECIGLAADWMIEGIEYKVDNIQTKLVVCKDQMDRKAREIDIALGFGQEVNHQIFISPVPSWQGFLDKYMTSKGLVNKPITEMCDKDRTGGQTGPFFRISSPTNGQLVGSAVSVQGGIYATIGQIATVKYYLEGQFIQDELSPNVSNLNSTVDLASLGLDNGVYTFKIVATDTEGQTNEYEIDIIIGGPIATGFSFTALPPTNLTYGVNVGSGIGHSIAITYTHPTGSITNVRLYQLKNGGSPTLLGNMSSGGGNVYTFSNWGAYIDNETATYSFYVVASAPNGGQVTSQVSSVISVN